MAYFTGQIFGLDASGEVHTNNNETYRVLPKVFDKFKGASNGKEKGELIELLACQVLVQGTLENDEFFERVNHMAFLTVEELKKVFVQYQGNEYDLWHDYGDEYISACKRFGITNADKKDWCTLF